MSASAALSLFPPFTHQSLDVVRSSGGEFDDLNEAHSAIPRFPPSKSYTLCSGTSIRFFGYPTQTRPSDSTAKFLAVLEQAKRVATHPKLPSDMQAVTYYSLAKRW